MSLDAEIATGTVIRQLIRSNLVAAVHDLSDGGLLVAIAEMCLAGSIGAKLNAAAGDTPAHAVWFGEDQGRYVVEASPDHVDRIREACQAAGVDLRVIGEVGGQDIKIGDDKGLALSSLRTAHENWLPSYMDGT